jgi:hypothetical protein
MQKMYGQIKTISLGSHPVCHSGTRSGFTGSIILACPVQMTRCHDRQLDPPGSPGCLFSTERPGCKGLVTIS